MLHDARFATLLGAIALGAARYVITSWVNKNIFNDINQLAYFTLSAAFSLSTLSHVYVVILELDHVSLKMKIWGKMTEKKDLLSLPAQARTWV